MTIRRRRFGIILLLFVLLFLLILVRDKNPDLRSQDVNLMIFQYLNRTINNMTSLTSTQESGQSNIKVACFVLATLNAKNKMAAVNDTWVQRCDDYFFLVTTNHGQRDVVNVTIPEGRTYLTDKTVYGFRYMYDHLLNDYDWFVKADDDTYMIVENLKFFLSHYKGDAPAYTGLHFRHYSPNGYMAGGPGYVLNRAALKQLIKGFNSPGLCRLTGGAEDLEIGRCLTKVGVPIINSLDNFRTQTFHGTRFHSYVDGSVSSYIPFYIKNTDNLNKVSRFTISFHHMEPNMIHHLDFILYNIQVKQPDLHVSKYFNMEIVKPSSNISKTNIMEYFYEKRSEYDDIETWRKKNATVLSHESPKRN